VKIVLERGANLFYCEEDEGKNGLHYACQNEDYAAAEEIVLYLIKKEKGMLRMVSDTQRSALHYAAEYSSAKICEILIDNGCDVNGRTKELSTPLIMSSCRIDNEVMKVTKLLIERGADVAKKNEVGNTALHLACCFGTDDLVQLLIDAKGNVNARTNNRQTPLMFATQNTLFWEKIIPILMRAGADVTLKELDGGNALARAYNSGGGKMLKMLAPFVPEGCNDLAHDLPDDENPDPIGSMTEGLRFGYNPGTDDFHFARNYRDAAPSMCWAMLRNGEFDISAIFRALSKSDNMDLWWYSVTEMWQRGQALDASTGETILHLAVKCTKLSAEDKIKIVQHITTFKINPLVLDNDNKRAIEYCTKEEKELHRMLAHYQQWKPKKKVMNWYGPYCRGRLRAFLLVEKRLQLGFPRDLRYLILSYVAEREYVWVPKKK
jgi:ankyrin repeat protein